MDPTTLILAEPSSDGGEFADWLRLDGLGVVEARSPQEALDLHRRCSLGLTLADVDDLLGAGLPFLRDVRALRPQADVVFVTPATAGQNVVQVMKAGATDLLFRPLDREALLWAVREVLGAHDRSRSEPQAWKALRGRFEASHIVAQSPQMLQLLTLAARVAPTGATVLITGESGTGKELLARAIHLNGQRARKPMLSINCAAIPETLLESELFGYRRGAFTGAHGDKPGLLAAADGGTLFLDELADLSLATQAKLLRFLQEGTFFPVGSPIPISADVRVLAATNADLSVRVHSGLFRHDLYYRLSVFPLHIAPLRDRPEDILPLARTFLQRAGEKIARKPPQLGRDVARLLLSRTWPGNVRELENAVERAVILCDGAQLAARDLRLLETGTLHSAPKVWELPEVGVDLPELNRRFVVEALERTQYNVSAAARLLGLTRPALRYRMEKYGLRAANLAA